MICKNVPPPFLRNAGKPGLVGQELEDSCPDAVPIGVIVETMPAFLEIQAPLKPRTVDERYGDGETRLVVTVAIPAQTFR